MRTRFFIVSLFALTACSPFGGTDSTIQHAIPDAANSPCAQPGPGPSDGGIGGCPDPLPDGGYATDTGGYSSDGGVYTGDAGAWGADAGEWGSDGGAYGADAGTWGTDAGTPPDAFH